MSEPWTDAAGGSDDLPLGISDHRMQGSNAQDACCMQYIWKTSAHPLHFTHRLHRMHAQVDAGLDSELVLGDPKAPRFVLWNNELLPTPSGPDVATFKLLSIWGKIRAGLGAAGFKQPMPGATSLAACLAYHIAPACPCVVTPDAAVSAMCTASSGGGGRADRARCQRIANPGALPNILQSDQ